MSKRFTEVLVENGCIRTDQVEVCAYGLEIMISTILQITSILVLSLFIKKFAETMLFFLAFVPLRIYAGGFHAKTKLNCYLTSIAVYAVFTCVLKTISGRYDLYIGVPSGILDVIIVFAFAPIVHKNRVMNVKEKKLYKIASRVIVVVELCLWMMIILVFRNRYYATAFLMGQITVILSMVYTIAKDNRLNARR